jgi:aldehyde dehydrogenase (NAD+)
MNQSYQAIYDAQKAFFKTGATKSYSFRKQQLKKLIDVFRSNSTLIEEAMLKDLHKHPQEVYMTELGPIYEEAKVQLRGMKQWMQPHTVPTPLFLLPSTTKLYPEPVGQTLIISPWNYPFLLTFRPVVGAIAAGNTILIKPSELSAHSAAVMQKIINENFPAEYMHVITGEGTEVIPDLLENFYFGHVMFTGSTMVGKMIMAMAAKQLSPVSLELGGKSPCIVDETANLKMAAKRIVWGKLLNCGQVCVAPDYLVVHEKVKEKLLEEIIFNIEKTYGKDQLQNDNYGRMINRRRFDAVVKYLNEGTIRYGGQTNEAENFIAPTILEDIHADAAIMREEIFGPVLPVFIFKQKEEVLQLIEKNPLPLALYLFTTNKETEQFFITNVQFGAGCINETVYQLGNSNIPFGGIGPSGHGGYLGKFSFDTFTHYKGVVKKVNWFEPFFRYPPFSKSKLKLWQLALGRK